MASRKPISKTRSRPSRKATPKPAPLQAIEGNAQRHRDRAPDPRDFAALLLGTLALPSLMQQYNATKSAGDVVSLKDLDVRVDAGTYSARDGAEIDSTTMTGAALDALDKLQFDSHGLIDQLAMKLESVLAEPTPQPGGGEESPTPPTPILRALNIRHNRHRGINARLEQLLERIRV